MNFMGVRVRKVGLVCWRRVEERREGMGGGKRRRLEGSWYAVACVYRVQKHEHMNIIFFTIQISVCKNASHYHLIWSFCVK